MGSHYVAGLRRAIFPRRLQPSDMKCVDWVHLEYHLVRSGGKVCSYRASTLRERQYLSWTRTLREAYFESKTIYDTDVLLSNQNQCLYSFA